MVVLNQLEENILYYVNVFLRKQDGAQQYSLLVIGLLAYTVVYLANCAYIIATVTNFCQHHGN